MAVEDTASPRVLAKIVYAGACSAGFVAASRDLAQLADLSISSERVRRACSHAAADRIDHQQQQQKAFQQKPLLEQTQQKPADVEAPDIACVMADGGRYQQLDRSDGAVGSRSARKGEHWKESRIGLLAEMTGKQYAEDPQPELPPELRYDAMSETLSEIGHTGCKLDMGEEIVTDSELPNSPSSEGLPGPELSRRHVVASRQCWEDFGSLLASQAWYHGFFATPRGVFVSDGSPAIEKLQKTHFRGFTSVADLLHVLSYSLAAARAVSVDEAAARRKYDAWAAKIWKGQVDDVIDELIAYGTKFGEPPPDVSRDDPREVIRRSRVYYENHAERMDYPSYRRQGFPLTSSLMESTVKQVSRRVKGSEKFWSSTGSEAILRLRGEYLSDDEPMKAHWKQRSKNAAGTRAYRSTGRAVTV